MSKGHRIFICFILCFEDGNETMFLPITPPLNIARLWPVRRFGGGA